MDAIASQRLAVDVSSLLGPRPVWQDTRPHVGGPPLVEGEYAAKFDLTLHRSRSSIGPMSSRGGGGSSAAARITRMLRQGSSSLSFQPGGVSEDGSRGGGGGRWDDTFPSGLWTDIAELRGHRRLRQYLATKQRRQGDAPMKYLTDEAEDWEELRRLQQQRRQQRQEEEAAAAAAAAASGGLSPSLSSSTLPLAAWQSQGSFRNPPASGGQPDRTPPPPQIRPATPTGLPPPPPPVVFVAESDWTAAAAAAGIKAEGMPAAVAVAAQLPSVAAQSLSQNTRVAEGPAKPAPTSVVLVHFQHKDQEATAASAGATSTTAAVQPPQPAPPRSPYAQTPRPPRRALSLQPLPAGAPSPSPLAHNQRGSVSSHSLGSGGPAGQSQQGPVARSVSMAVRVDKAAPDSVAAAAAAAGFLPGVERYHTGFTLPSSALSTVADRLSPRSLVIASQMVEVVEVLQPPRLVQRRPPSRGHPGPDAAPGLPEGPSGVRDTQRLRSMRSKRVSDSALLTSAAGGLSRSTTRRGTMSTDGQGNVIMEGVDGALRPTPPPAGLPPSRHELAVTDMDEEEGFGGAGGLAVKDGRPDAAPPLLQRASVADPSSWASAMMSMRERDGVVGGGLAADAASQSTPAPRAEHLIDGRPTPPALGAWGRAAAAVTAAAAAVVGAAANDSKGDGQSGAGQPPKQQLNALSLFGGTKVDSLAAVATAVIRAQRWRRLAASPGAGTQVDTHAFEMVAEAEAAVETTRPLGLVAALATSGSQVVVRAPAGGAPAAPTPQALAAGAGNAPLGPMATKRMRSRAVAQLQKVWSLGAREAAAATRANAAAAASSSKLASFASSRRSSVTGLSSLRLPTRASSGALGSPSGSRPRVVSPGPSEEPSGVLPEPSDRPLSRDASSLRGSLGYALGATQGFPEGPEGPGQVSPGASPALRRAQSVRVMDVIQENDLEGEEEDAGPAAGGVQASGSQGRRAIGVGRNANTAANVGDPASNNGSPGSQPQAPASSTTLRLDQPSKHRRPPLRSKSLANLVIPSRNIIRWRADVRGGDESSSDDDDGSGNEDDSAPPVRGPGHSLAPRRAISMNVGTTTTTSSKGASVVGSEGSRDSDFVSGGGGGSTIAAALRQMHSASSGGGSAAGSSSSGGTKGAAGRWPANRRRSSESLHKLFSDQLRLAALVYDASDDEESDKGAEDPVGEEPARPVSRGGSLALEPRGALGHQASSGSGSGGQQASRTGSLKREQREAGPALAASGAAAPHQQGAGEGLAPPATSAVPRQAATSAAAPFPAAAAVSEQQPKTAKALPPDSRQPEVSPLLSVPVAPAPLRSAAPPATAPQAPQERGLAQSFGASGAAIAAPVPFPLSEEPPSAPAGVGRITTTPHGDGIQGAAAGAKNGGLDRASAADNTAVVGTVAGQRVTAAAATASAPTVVALPHAPPPSSASALSDGHHAARGAVPRGEQQDKRRQWLLHYKPPGFKATSPNGGAGNGGGAGAPALAVKPHPGAKAVTFADTQGLHAPQDPDAARAQVHRSGPPASAGPRPPPSGADQAGRHAAGVADEAGAAEGAMAGEEGGASNAAYERAAVGKGGRRADSAGRSSSVMVY